MRRALVLGLLLLGLMGNRSVCAQQIDVLLERDVDVPGATDLSLLNFSSQLNFLNGVIGFQVPSSLDLPAGVSVAGFDINGTEFNLLLERDVDVPGATDLSLLNFSSQLNFLNGVIGFQVPSSLDLPAGVSVAGFDINGTEFNLLLERDVDVPGATDLSLLNFSSQLNFLNGVIGFQVPSSLDLPAGVSVAGFDINGTEFNLLLERDVDVPGATDLSLLNFSSQLNFLNGVIGFQVPSSLDLPAGVSVAGFAIQSGDTPVPVPSTVALLGLALAGLGFSRHRTK